MGGLVPEGGGAWCLEGGWNLGGGGGGLGEGAAAVLVG